MTGQTLTRTTPAACGAPRHGDAVPDDDMPDVLLHGVRCAHRYRRDGMKSLLVTLTAVLLSSACSEGGSPGPLTPTPIPTPAPATPTSSSAGWSVTIQTTAATGPAFCIFTPSVGAVFKGDYDLVWHGDSVSFAPPDPIDWDSFTATLTGSHFTAMNPPHGHRCRHHQCARDRP